VAAGVSSGAVRHDRVAPEPSLAKSVRRGREAAALMLFAVAAFLLLSLLSLRQDPADPTVTGGDWVGPVGAAAAGILVQAFGIVAWLAPVELGLVGLPLLRGRRDDTLGLRVAGDLIVAIILSALVQVAAPDARAFGAMIAGGNVGLFFGELMRGLFSTAGSFLVGSTIVGLILIGRSSFSFIALCQRAERAFRLICEYCQRIVAKLSMAWSDARELRREKLDAERAQALPRIDVRPTDEAIIAELTDDDSDWIPLETTGEPPLAISAALRDGMRETTQALLEAAGTPPPAKTLSSPVSEKREIAAPRRTRDKERAPKTARASRENAAERTASDASVAATREAANEAVAEPSAPDVVPEPAAQPVEPVAAVPEPRIVDTKPQQEVKRAATKREKSGFKLPAPELLEPPSHTEAKIDRERILENAALLEKTLADYGVSAKVEEIHPGPTVTTYEVAPEAGTKVSKVANLSDDLALGLSRKVRIIAPIPGKSRIGFELPNDERVPVNLRELIEDKRFAKLAERAPLPVVLGRDIVGAPFYADLASMPHVIVAGATGAGKSVGLNVMLSSLLFCRTPDELRMLMIDPKVVELAPFDGIPHMLLPVVTDMKQAATALKWAVNEMERRYQLFADAGTKNIGTYNNWVQRVLDGDLPAPNPEQVQAMSPDGVMVSVAAAKDGSDGVPLPGKLPYIVIVVDEFADLMMQQGKEVEAAVARLAQKARAAGMHVVLATQRPSVDVITGMIKANFPTRIAFRVAQKVDSRTILDEQGAEWLLGRGDMLVKLNGSTDTRRVQCPFVSEEEVNGLTDYLRAQGTPQYHDAILVETAEDGEEGVEEEPVDPRFDEAVRIVGDTQRCSTSWLQRKMTIGYNRAAKIVEMMEKRGIVGPPNGARDREVLISAQ
jgi:S-DNA-T family DNA segregation ATPase FtsK/SpoIIIE